MVTAVLVPEIEVTGNSVVIADGDATPSTADHTDFGSTVVGTAVTRTFTVKNVGTAALTTSGLTVPSGYTVTEGLAASIAAGGQDTFTVRLDAAATGTYAGDVSFGNNDSNENPFNFRITGEVAPVVVLVPEVEVMGNSVVIEDGDASPSTADHTDFGSTMVGTAVTRTFTVKNVGTAALTTSGLTVPSGYTVTEGLAASIAASGQDTFTVRLDATATGTYAGDVSFGNNDSNENPFNFRITAVVTAVLVPEIEVTGNSVVIADGDATPSTADHTDFGSTVVGTAVTRTFTVKNVGTVALTTSGLTVPSGYTVTEGLAASIAAGGQDTFTVRLDATATGTYAGDVSFGNNDSNENPFNFRITAVVTAVLVPEIEVMGNSVEIADGDGTPTTADHTDFGSTTAGTAVSRVFTVKNVGTAVLTTSGLTVPSGYTVTEGLAASIAAGGQDTFTVRLDAAAAGTYAGQVSFVNNDSNENPYNFQITGVVTAVLVPEVEVTGNGVVIVDGDGTPSTADHTDFGSTTAGTAVSRVFTVKNVGTAVLTTSGLTVPSGYTVTEGLAASIAAGGQDTFTVRLDAAAAGTYAGDVSFNNDDSDENPFNFRITGEVTAVVVLEPEIEVRGNNIVIADGDTTPSTADYTDFGTMSLGATASRIFTVKNIGSATLTTSGLTVPSGFTVTEALAATIAVNGQDSFTVRFNAAAGGTYTGEVSFANNDSDENPFNFQIKGVITAPEIEVTGNAVVIADGDATPSAADDTDFGSTTVGTAVSRVFTVKNAGTAALTTSVLSVPSGYTVTEGLAATIAASGQDTFTVQLDAAAAGTYAGDVSFSNNDSNENPFNFRITGEVTAVVVLEPEIEVTGNSVEIVDGDATPSAADDTDFGTTTVGTALDRVFTVKNVGTAALTTSGLTVPSGYTVTEGLAGSIAASGQDTFTIRLDAVAAGTYAGDVSFSNDDSDENPFNFRITGEVTAVVVLEPEIEVTGNSVEIVDGDATPSAADDTDFGTTTVGTALDRVFTVKNVGTAALTTSGLTVPSGYTVTEGLAGSIAASGQDTFTIRLDAVAAGTYAGDVSFSNDDSDENPFSFQITGLVEASTTTELTVEAGTGGTTTPSGTLEVTKGVATAISATTDNVGYAFVNWTVTSGTAAIMSPYAASTTVTISAPATVRANFVAMNPTVTVAATDAVAGEPSTGSGTGTFTFARTGSTESPLTVNFTVGGTATSGTDYTALGTTVIFDAGSSTATKTVSVLDDNLNEADETVVLRLASGAGYTLISRSSVTVTIKDDDQELPWVLTKSLGTKRNNYGNWVGARFQVGAAPIKVSRLGRIFVAGNAQNHPLILVDGSTKVTVASVTWTPAGGVDGQFKYMALASPVTLEAGKEYYLMSQEFYNGDWWYDVNTTATTTAAAALLSGVYTTNWRPNGGLGQMYVPVDFIYSVSSGGGLLAAALPASMADGSQAQLVSEAEPFESVTGGAVAPVITQVETSPEGLVLLRIEGPSGSMLEVLGSSDLVQWQSLGQATNHLGTVQIADPGAVGTARRFYRVCQPALIETGSD
ncbi:MAG TPA: choice-of-anchor D domain-containing protein [Verrucomicrobiota bacterium]|nr:choice-of-anchor D domain-containing protein [Verrucomicrobiota bacterium]